MYLKPLVEFVYVAFTCMPDESNCKRLRCVCVLSFEGSPLFADFCFQENLFFVLFCMF